MIKAVNAAQVTERRKARARMQREGDLPAPLMFRAPALSSLRIACRPRDMRRRYQRPWQLRARSGAPCDHLRVTGKVAAHPGAGILSGCMHICGLGSGCRGRCTVKPRCNGHWCCVIHPAAGGPCESSWESTASTPVSKDSFWKPWTRLDCIYLLFSSSEAERATPPTSLSLRHRLPEIHELDLAARPPLRHAAVQKRHVRLPSLPARHGVTYFRESPHLPETAFRLKGTFGVC